MITITHGQLCDTLRTLGYPVWTKPYDLNIYGIRKPGGTPDDWDDTIGVAWRDREGNSRIICCPATVDPGLHYLLNPMNARGTAIMAEGYHRGIWTLGKHKGYAALVQVKPAVFYRDYNKNRVLDYKTDRMETAIIGANLHRGHPDVAVAKVGQYSAGCQVVQNAFDLTYILALVHQQGKSIGTTSVSYALMNETLFGAK